VRFLGRPETTVFMLHRFAKTSAQRDRTSVNALRVGLERMRAAGIAFESISGLLSRIATGARVTRPTAVFTVDDGYADFAELAAPIFDAMRCPVTVFLSTDVISGRLWYWWDELEWLLWSARADHYEIEILGGSLKLDLGTPGARVRTLNLLISTAKQVTDTARRALIAALGQCLGVDRPERAPSAYRTLDWADVRSLEGEFVRFGPHSRTHPILSRLDDDGARAEIESSWAVLQRECVRPEPVFCYPDGTADSFGVREERFVQQAGLLGAVIYSRARLPASPVEALQHRFHVPRVEFPLDPYTAVVLAAGATLSRSESALAPRAGAFGNSPRHQVRDLVRRDRALVEVSISNVTTTRHHYGVLRGLTDLAETGEVRLSFCPRRDWHFPNASNPMFATFRADGSPPVTVCYDMMDWPDIAMPEALELCDVYVKRSADPAGYPELPRALSHKIVRWGLSLPATIEKSRYALQLYLRRFKDADLSVDRAQRLRDLAKSLVLRVRPRTHSGYAIDPHELPVPDYDRLASDPRVFLQTRLWDPRKTASRHFRTTNQLNHFRVELVGALRSALGDRLVGGIIPSAVAREMSPELQTNLGADFGSYLRAMGGCLIAVTETGLHGSNGARLPEFLGAGRCVVAEQLVYSPLVAPKSGEQIMFYGSIEECVEQCRTLLAEPQKAVRIAKGGLQFYLEEVAPASMARRFLEASGIRR